MQGSAATRTVFYNRSGNRYSLADTGFRTGFWTGRWTCLWNCGKQRPGQPSGDRRLDPIEQHLVNGNPAAAYRVQESQCVTQKTDGIFAGADRKVRQLRHFGEGDYDVWRR